MKIALFAYENRALESYPPIKNSIEVLRESGFQVTIFIPFQMKPIDAIEGLEVEVVSGPNSNDYISSTVRIITEKKLKFDVLISYYKEGLIISSILREARQFKFASLYWSMELYTTLSFFGDYKKYQKIASLAKVFLKSLWSRRPVHYLIDSFKGYSLLRHSSLDYIRREMSFVDGVIIQDEKRLAELTKEMGVTKQFFLVPNSYRGKAIASSLYSKKIPTMVYAGGIDKSFDFLLIDKIIGGPKKWRFIINGYCSDDTSEKIKTQYIKAINEGWLSINDNLLSDREYDELVKSADIGLIWYATELEEIPNMYFLGLSSGKLSKYLSLGKPVISTSNLYGYRQLFQSNGLGSVIDGPDELPHAISSILSDYETYSQNVVRFYDESLDFDKAIAPVVSFLRRFDDRNSL